MARSNFRGSSDKDLWAKAAKEKRIIVTRDLDYPIVGSRPAPFGVILLRVPTDFKASAITQIFKDSAEQLRFEELRDKVAVISPGKIRISIMP